MKLAKKMLAFVLALSVFAVLGVGAAFAAAPAVTLSADKAEVAVGDTVQFTLAANGATGMETGGMEITYDPAVLEFVSAEGAIIKGMVETGKADEGLVTAGIIFSKGATDDSVTFATYQFKALKTGTATLSGTVTEFTVKGDDVAVGAFSGSVNIVDEITQPDTPVNPTPVTPTTPAEPTSGKSGDKSNGNKAVAKTGDAGIAAVAGVLAVAAVAFVATRKRED